MDSIWTLTRGAVSPRRNRYMVLWPFSLGARRRSHTHTHFDRRLHRSSRRGLWPLAGLELLPPRVAYWVPPPRPRALGPRAGGSGRRFRPGTGRGRLSFGPGRGRAPSQPALVRIEGLGRSLASRITTQPEWNSPGCSAGRMMRSASLMYFKQIARPRAHPAAQWKIHGATGSRPCPCFRLCCSCR